jgi:hypothetical protein
MRKMEMASEALTAADGASGIPPQEAATIPFWRYHKRSLAAAGALLVLVGVVCVGWSGSSGGGTAGAGGMAGAQPSAAPPVRVLFVGNSFTYGPAEYGSVGPPQLPPPALSHGFARLVLRDIAPRGSQRTTTGWAGILG